MSDDSLNLLKSDIRSVLIAAKNGFTANELIRDYKEFVGNDINFREYGCTTLHSLLAKIPDVCRIEQHNGGFIYHAIADASTRNIQQLVSRQRTSKKPKMQGMRGPMHRSSNVCSTTGNNRAARARRRNRNVTNQNKMIGSSKQASNMQNIASNFDKNPHRELDLKPTNYGNHRTTTVGSSSSYMNNGGHSHQSVISSNARMSPLIMTGSYNPSSIRFPATQSTHRLADSLKSMCTLNSAMNNEEKAPNFYQQNIQDNKLITSTRMSSMILQYLSRFPNGVSLKNLRDEIAKTSNVNFQTPDELRSQLAKLEPQIVVDENFNRVFLSRFKTAQLALNRIAHPVQVRPLLPSVFHIRQNNDCHTTQQPTVVIEQLSNSLSLRSPIPNEHTLPVTKFVDCDEVLITDRLLRIVKDYPEGINIHSIWRLYFDRYNTPLNIGHHSTLEQLFSNMSSFKVITINDHNYVITTNKDSKSITPSETSKPVTSASVEKPIVSKSFPDIAPERVNFYDKYYATLKDVQDYFPDVQDESTLDVKSEMQVAVHKTLKLTKMLSLCLEDILFISSNNVEMQPCKSKDSDASFHKNKVNDEDINLNISILNINKNMPKSKNRHSRELTFLKDIGQALQDNNIFLAKCIWRDRLALITNNANALVNKRKAKQKEK
ncbi:hypothetical protein GJ496_011153 [Pomphorhynchus laevis]|nr:hypothetical protein GJ496_011153 [Pomphorhynchus laevis]